MKTGSRFSLALTIVVLLNSYLFGQAQGEAPPFGEGSAPQPMPAPPLPPQPTMEAVIGHVPLPPQEVAGNVDPRSHVDAFVLSPVNSDASKPANKVGAFTSPNVAPLFGRTTPTMPMPMPNAVALSPSVRQPVIHGNMLPPPSQNVGGPSTNGTLPPNTSSANGGECTAGSSDCYTQADCQPCSGIHFGVFGDFLYLKARGTNLIFAQPRDGSTILSSPLGSQGILEPDYAPGFRAGFNVALSPCSCLQASFLWWESQTSSAVVAPESPVGAVIHSTLILPSVQNPAADGLAANASMGLSLRNIDVDYSHLLVGQPGCYTVHWLAGARYGFLQQNMHSQFAILGTTDVDTNINFEGIGPRVGLNGEVCCGCGLRIYGGGAANLLAGHFGATYNQFNVFAGNQGNIDYRSDRIVPVMEMELGVGWVSPGGHVSVGAGYYVGAWFNSVITPDFIDAVQANDFSTSGGNLQSNFTIDGLTFRLGLRF